jgi:hypothetical protein
VRGVHWPDERVVAATVVEFFTSDRPCLLTQTPTRDERGLRWSLEQEVGPALETFSPRRLGRLALAQRPGASLAAYAAAVEARLTPGGVSPGCRWETPG